MCVVYVFCMFFEPFCVIFVSFSTLFLPFSFHFPPFFLLFSTFSYTSLDIDRQNLLPPMQVLEILSENSNVTLSVVKDYITKRMQREDQSIAEDTRLVRNYQEETEKMRQEIDELRTSAKIFQLMKCSACSSPLDLPAVHFLCMHSYHQRCLGDNERECLLCAQGNRTILEIKRSQEANAGRHEQFFKMLEGSEDGFSVVADYFGRNLFNKMVLVEPEGRK